jgi:hypothetical protein
MPLVLGLGQLEIQAKFLKTWDAKDCCQAEKRTHYHDEITGITKRCKDSAITAGVNLRGKLVHADPSHD